jgi:hypothetical protein
MDHVKIGTRLTVISTASAALFAAWALQPPKLSLRVAEPPLIVASPEPFEVAPVLIVAEAPRGAPRQHRSVHPIQGTRGEGFVGDHGRGVLV